MANTVFKNVKTGEISLVTTNAKLFNGIMNGKVKPLIGDKMQQIANVKLKIVANWKSYHIKLRNRLASDENVEILTELTTYIKEHKHDNKQRQKVQS